MASVATVGVEICKVAATTLVGLETLGIIGGGCEVMRYAWPKMKVTFSIEVDGRGTLMAKRSSILNDNHNPGATQAEVEAYFRRYLGVNNFIWLDGTAGLDITDDHIDGTARFANGDTIVTLKKQDFIVPTEYDILTRATNADGKPYKIVHLPLTAKEIPSIGEHGLYINYYAGNSNLSRCQ
ncbi:unnamed protein product [Cylindrotheca closterium]|uniref:Agmatine deiminase n=1 Tax=Cylindrotheca closterium TaxID=2856 RepID=A0AAD2FCW6_9STRA|nr:unnamed protein product [Cylindrotheca closterium]